MELKDTVNGMLSSSYKERFIAEYQQLKIRYEKLKAFNTKIEAAHRTESRDNGVDMPIHDCPDGLLREQQCQMGELLHTLEVRAVIEGIDLTMPEPEPVKLLEGCPVKIGDEVYSAVEDEYHVADLISWRVRGIAYVDGKYYAFGDDAASGMCEVGSRLCIPKTKTVK